MVKPAATRDPFGAALRVGAAAHAAPLDEIDELAATGAQLLGGMLAEPAFVAAAAAALERHVASRGLSHVGDPIRFSHAGVPLKLTTSPEEGELHLAFEDTGAPDGFAADLNASRTTLRELAAAILSGNFDFGATAAAAVALLAAPTLRGDERQRLLIAWSAALGNDEAAKAAVAATALRLASPAPGSLVLTCTIPSLKPPEPPPVHLRTRIELTQYNRPTEVVGPTVVLRKGREYLLSATLVDAFHAPGSREAFRYKLGGLRLVQRADDGQGYESAAHVRVSQSDEAWDRHELRSFLTVTQNGPLTVEVFGTGTAWVELSDVTGESWVPTRARPPGHRR